MLDMKARAAGENHLLFPSANDEPMPKSQVFNSKMEDFINFHLDYSKYNKKLRDQMEQKEVERPEAAEPLKKTSNKKNKADSSEQQSEIKQIQQSLLRKISSLEKISNLAKSANRIVASLEHIENPELLLSKIANSTQIFNTIQEIVNNETSNFYALLTLLDSFSENQASNLATLKKDLIAKNKEDRLAITEKYENKIKALVEHNKILSSNKYEYKASKKLQQRIEHLEGLLSVSDSQMLDKQEQIKQKSFELASFQERLQARTDDIEKFRSEKLNLESLIKIQQESYHGQIYDLTSEIARIKNQTQESKLAHDLAQSELLYKCENYKSRLDQAVSELKNSEDQINYIQSASRERESLLEQENRYLHTEIQRVEIEIRNSYQETQRLERIVMDLKEDLDSSHKALDLQQLETSKSKEEEVLQLTRMIEKLESEGAQLIKSNQELSAINNRLEQDLAKSKEAKKLKSSKSEKKIKKYEIIKK